MRIVDEIYPSDIRRTVGPAGTIKRLFSNRDYFAGRGYEMHIFVPLATGQGTAIGEMTTLPPMASSVKQKGGWKDNFKAKKHALVESNRFTSSWAYHRAQKAQTRLIEEYIALGRTPDIIVFHDFYSCYLYQERRKEKKAKLAMFIHGPGDDDNQFSQRRPKLVGTKDQAQTREVLLKAFEYADEVVWISQNGKRIFLGNHPQYEAKTSTVVNGINDMIPVETAPSTSHKYRMVTTGTAVALAKKFTMANINDGLATRVAITPMDPRRYKMIARGTLERNLDREVRLKQWGFWMDRLKGHLNIDRLVDHVYELCSQSAQEAEATDDEVLDTLRRRAVFYAEWFTVPRIVARLRREDGSTAPMEELTVTDDDLRWATVMYDAVVYWQDYFFGQMLQDSWENAKRSFQPRQRTSRNAQLYAGLPEEFTGQEAVKILNSNQKAVNMQLSRWVQSGYIVRIAQGKYKKLLNQII